MTVSKLQAIDSIFDDFMVKINHKHDNNIIIAGHQFVLSGHLNKYLQKMIEKYDNINFTILNIPLSDATKKLLDGEIDIMLYDINESYNAAIEVKPFVCEEWVMMAPKSYDICTKTDKSITWEDLAKVNLIQTVNNQKFEQLSNISKNCFKNQISYINVIYEMCKNAAISGLGATFCPKSYVLEADKQAVQVKDISHLLGFYKANIGIKKNAKMKKLAQELISILQS